MTLSLTYLFNNENYNSVPQPCVSKDYDTTGKTKFPVSVANELVLEFLDLSLDIDEAA